jgi:uncharacterized membrane protein YfcA
MIPALLLMLAVGLSLGLLGSGGSTITLPVLVYVARIPVSQAVAMSLVIVGATAAVGSYLLSRRRGFEGRTVATFAVTGITGAYFGARLTHLVPPAVLMVLFGGVMATAGARMLRAKPPAPAAGRAQLARCIVAGLVLGVLTGFLGVGGGFLILPTLLLFAGLDMHRAVPTSLAIIACNAAGGLAGQLTVADLHWPLTFGFLAMALAGMGAGTVLASRLRATTLQRVFAWAILCGGCAIVIHNVRVLLT